MAGDSDPPECLSWLRGFPSLETCQVSSLNIDGKVSTVRHVLDCNDNIMNNRNGGNNSEDAVAGIDPLTRHGQGDTSPNAALLAKLKQEQDVMKATFVSFRRWAMDATKALRTLEARAESAERRAVVNQTEVLRLQELLAKSDRTRKKTRKRKAPEGRVEGPEGDVVPPEYLADLVAEDLEEEGSSGDSDDCLAKRAAHVIPDRKQSKC